MAIRKQWIHGATVGVDEDTGARLTDEEAGQRTERVVYGSPKEIRAELERLEEGLEKVMNVFNRRAEDA